MQDVYAESDLTLDKNIISFYENEQMKKKSEETRVTRQKLQDQRADTDRDGNSLVMPQA